MKPLPLLSEVELDRTRGRPYDGPIEVGQIFAWEPDIPTARCLCIVSRIELEPPPPMIVHHAQGTAVLSNGFGPVIWTWDFPDRTKECWNNEDSFREAVVPTKFKPHTPE